MFEARRINDRITWEGLLVSYNLRTTFTQSWAWGEFNETQGVSVRRWGIYNGETLVAAFTGFCINARRGKFYFLPYGPLVADWSDQRVVDFVFRAIEADARQQRASFIRVSPYLKRDSANCAIFKKHGFVRAPIHMHPELAWILDITPSPEVILRNMRKSTRYEIKRAEKLNIRVDLYKDTKAIDKYFYRMFEETVFRHSFVPFSKLYLKSELDVLGKYDEAVLFIARQGVQVLAGALVVFHGASAYYHHGASATANRNLPGAHAVQWRAINEAKRRGLKEYNFWGIQPANKRSHPWRGTTFFKQGFGGRSLSLIPAQDKVLKLAPYTLTYVIETMRRFKRGF